MLNLIFEVDIMKNSKCAIKHNGAINWNRLEGFVTIQDRYLRNSSQQLNRLQELGIERTWDVIRALQVQSPSEPSQFLTVEMDMHLPVVCPCAKPEMLTRGFS